MSSLDSANDCNFEEQVTAQSHCSMDTLFCMEEMCRVAFYPNVQDLCPKVYLEDARGGNRQVAKQNDLSSEMQETV